LPAKSRSSVRFGPTCSGTQETRTELKRADLTGTNMEIWTAVYEFPVGYTIPAHSHKGEEVVYVLEGAKRCGEDKA
jgi:quercetin dioxygenase-like cupin family protein